MTPYEEKNGLYVLAYVVLIAFSLLIYISIEHRRSEGSRELHQRALEAEQRESRLFVQLIECEMENKETP